MKNIRIIAMVGLCLTILSMLDACGTVRGFGQDVSRAGRDIQRAAH